MKKIFLQVKILLRKELFSINCWKHLLFPGVKLDDILTGDKNAIFMSARILAYGKDYKIKFKDPSNGEDVEDMPLILLS